MTTPPRCSGFRADYLQAFREARANGRDGYKPLRNPRARMAAYHVLTLRSQGDALDAFHKRFAYCDGWQRMAVRARMTAPPLPPFPDLPPLSRAARARFAELNADAARRFEP